MIILLYTVVPRGEAQRETHEEMTRKMQALAEATSKFLGAEYYDRSDGGTFGVFRFEDEQALAAWRDHPDHGETHRRGVEEVYATYQVEICQRVRDASFTWEPASG